MDCVVRSPNSGEGLGAVKELGREGRQVPHAHLLLAVIERVNDRRHLGAEGVIVSARPHLGGGSQVVPDKVSSELDGGALPSAVGRPCGRQAGLGPEAPD